MNEVYFTTLDIEATLKKVVAHGGAIVKQTENSVGKAAHCQDNQGIHIWFPWRAWQGFFTLGRTSIPNS